MKKIQLLIIAISAILFASCNSTSKEKNENAENATQVETTKSTNATHADGGVIYLTNETFKQKGLDLSIEGIQPEFVNGNLKGLIVTAFDMEFFGKKFIFASPEVIFDEELSISTLVISTSFGIE